MDFIGIQRQTLATGTDIKGYTKVIEEMSSFATASTFTCVPYLSGYKTGFCPYRMTSNN